MHFGAVLHRGRMGSYVGSECRFASTAVKASAPAGRGSRGSRMPFISADCAEEGGIRSPSAAARSTTSPATATGSYAIFLTPRPRTSIKPASAAGGRSEQSSVAGGQLDTVVSDQACKPNESGGGGVDQRQRETRLAAARRPADQQGTAADQHRRSMHRRRCGLPHFAGRRTTKRAPRTAGGSSGVETLRRFSAHMRPACASTICLEIDRPSPEFWPKPCSGRSV